MPLIFLINFLLAISTTIGMTIIPLLVTDSLGLSLLVLGILEGTTEFISNVLRLTNGILFDKIKNKRILFVCSVGMAFVSKALLLIPAPFIVFFSKTLERVANGAFASPRDALVAEKAKNKGIALGWLNVSKTAGCILGPLIVSISTFFWGDIKNNLQLFVAFCCILVVPALAASFFLNVKSIEKTQFSFQELKRIFKEISPILLLAFLFFMGRFNDGLLMLYLKQKGFPQWFYLSTISIFNFVMLIISPFIGNQIDRGYFKKMLYMTICALGISNICFYQIDFSGWLFATIGLIAWGIQRTGAQIVFSSLVFKGVNKAHYGAAIGLFYVISGFATMSCSFLAGYIAVTSLSSVFILSGLFSFLALGASLSILNNKISTLLEKNPLPFST